MGRDSEPRELGVLVGVTLADDPDPWTLEASLDELAALATSAGVEVVGRAWQRLEHPFPATYIGSGKVEEIQAAVLDLGAEVVLFDHSLSPRQQRNLERELGVKVIDRTALILDVFARHARTREGMLQVALAQYEYRLPRLTRLWTHLARQAGGGAGGVGGGVGVRGPGETQLELDRRDIRRRIAGLREEIEALRTQRRQSRRQRRRSGLPSISLVGYTNAGKSTLLNALAGSDVYTADQLFATLDPTTRRVSLPSGRTVLLSDTVGFIQKLPTELVASFRATLEEIAEADLLVHVVDVTHPDAVQQAETVEAILGDLGMSDPPMVVAANKVDRLTDRTADGEADEASATVDAGGEDTDDLARLRVLYPDLVPISAVRGLGLDDLLRAIDEELVAQLVAVDALVPYDRGDVVNLIHVHGIVEDEGYEPTGTRLRARIPPYLLGGVEAYLVSSVAILEPPHRRGDDDEPVRD